MLNLIDQYRCNPTAETARRLRDLFERNPSRIWVLQSEDLRMVAAAGVRAAEAAPIVNAALSAARAVSGSRATRTVAHSPQIPSEAKPGLRPATARLDPPAAAARHEDPRRQTDVRGLPARPTMALGVRPAIAAVLLHHRRIAEQAGELVKRVCNRMSRASGAGSLGDRGARPVGHTPTT